jgi:hypothetical protein
MDYHKHWRVTEGVWVEMFCFSTSRCRDYLHAKSLGSGGEYLSYIWLLLSHLCDTPSVTVAATVFYSTSIVQPTMYLGLMFNFDFKSFC